MGGEPGSPTLLYAHLRKEPLKEKVGGGGSEEKSKIRIQIEKDSVRTLKILQRGDLREIGKQEESIPRSKLSSPPEEGSSKKEEINVPWTRVPQATRKMVHVGKGYRQKSVGQTCCKSKWAEPAGSQSA